MSKGWEDPRARGRAWRTLRARILAENLADPEHHGLCHLRIPGVCTGAATQVHHTMGIARTGHDPRYLQPACAPCNNHVGDPMAVPNPPHVPLTQW